MPILKIIDLVQGSPEWHEYRSKGIGASDASIIMGVSPWATPYQLWIYNNGLSEKKEMTQSMKFGSDNEQQLREYFQQKKNVQVQPKVVESSLYPWMFASMDGLSEDGEIAVEIKCTNAEYHKMCKESRVPDVYYPQVQHQMFVCELDQIYYLSYWKGNHDMILVDRNDFYIEKMIDKELEFLKCMTDFVAPELTDKDFVEIQSEKFAMLTNEYVRSFSTLKHITDIKERLRQQIIEECNGRSSFNADIKATKYVIKGRVDYDSIPELKNVDLNKYRKEPTESWRITEI